MKRALLATLVASAFAAAAPTAMAESANPATDGVVAAQGATEAPSVQRQVPPQRAFRLPSERIEARLAYLKTALKITAAQTPQWESFASVLRANARNMDKRIQDRRAQGAQPRTSVSAIDRLERMQSRMQQRSARLGEIITAAKPLYATFSPEQKQVADELLAKSGRRHGGGRFQHRGMHRTS